MIRLLGEGEVLVVGKQNATVAVADGKGGYTVANFEKGVETIVPKGAVDSISEYADVVPAEDSNVQ